MFFTIFFVTNIVIQTWFWNKIFQNFEISVNGNFTSEYNDIQLISKKGRMFPISNAETVGEAIAVINGYMTGLSHGKDNSYPKFCDKDNY